MPDQALLRLKTLEFEGAGTYRESTGPIVLEKQGRVLIAGQEGSGKSMIPEVLTLIMQGKGSPRMRKTGFSESSIVNERGYRGVSNFESGYGSAARLVEIMQAFKHKRDGSRYTITIDGQREEPNGKLQQKKLVKRLVPLSLEEWLGVVYLHQGAVHDLLAGAPAEKKSYLTSVFGLDFYDDLIEVAKAERKGLKDQGISALALQQKLVDVAAELDTAAEVIEHIDIDSVLAEIKSLRDELRDMDTLKGKVQASKQVAEQYAETTAAIEKLAGKGKDRSAKALTKAQADLKATNHKIASDEASLRQHESLVKARTRAQTAVDAAKKSVATATAVLKKCPEVADEDGVNYEAALELLRSVRFSHGVVLADAGKGPSAGAEWHDAIVRAHATGVTLEKLEKLKAKNLHQCPTCAQDVSDLMQVIDSLVKSQALDYGEGLRGIRDQLLSLWPRAPINKTIVWLEESIETRFARQAARVEAQETLDEAQEAVQEALERLEETPDPGLATDLREALEAAQETQEAIEEAIKRLTKLCGLYDLEESLRDACADTDLSDLEHQLEGLAKRRAAVAAKHTALTETKEEFDTGTATIKALSKQKREIESKLQEHAEAAAMIQHYDLTLLPYFDALRGAKVKACVSALEGILPVYVGAMSSAQYLGAEVKIQVSDDLSSMDLLLKPGRHSDWVSAVQSSGGQRRRFTLAIIAALREVSPRRANVMFFDEPFADLQGEGKILFVNRLLPLLLDRCTDLESVFVIAHDQEVLEAGEGAFDNVWIAKRDVTGSKLLFDQRMSDVKA